MSFYFNGSEAASCVFYLIFGRPNANPFRQDSELVKDYRGSTEINNYGKLDRFHFIAKNPFLHYYKVNGLLNF